MKNKKRIKNISIKSTAKQTNLLFTSERFNKTQKFKINSSWIDDES